ncbi:STAS domain-containing protein [Lentzea sp. PSKA42]|uniref:Anti-sigma factor antagonist n=1 Tax=Lentzea indica TaxID=2604800 RepID=A0ABX1FVP3_9PSEU|nr:STAS domain-containing protein [Lentzea indica]NKE62503.1 STAS domain-containing protein [Lentzea indica]
MSGSSMRPLEVQREAEGLAVVVRAAGELDQYTVPVLRTEIDAAFAAATPPSPVVVDLTGIDFFGSAGINELVIQHERATGGPVPLRIVAPQEKVLRPIALTGLDDVLDIYPELELALHCDRPALPRMTN